MFTPKTGFSSSPAAVPVIAFNSLQYQQSQFPWHIQLVCLSGPTRGIQFQSWADVAVPSSSSQHRNGVRGPISGTAALVTQRQCDQPAVSTQPATSGWYLQASNPMQPHASFAAVYNHAAFIPCMGTIDSSAHEQCCRLAVSLW